MIYTIIDLISWIFLASGIVGKIFFTRKAKEYREDERWQFIRNKTVLRKFS